MTVTANGCRGHNCSVTPVQTQLPRARRRLLALGGLFLLVSCASGPPAPEAPPAPSPPAPPGPGTGPLPGGGPAAAPTPEPPPEPPVDPQQAVRSAIAHLQDGAEAEAEAELRRVLQVEPNNRLAASLLRQITDDPVALLGRESFTHRVQPGESLSIIARTYLKDPYLFYALARYNNIKVPRQLAGGQVIRVPGKAPAAASPPPASAPTPAPAPAPAPVPAPAPAPVPAPAPPPAPVPAPAPAPTPPAAPAPRDDAKLVAEHTRAARACAAKQDLCCAIRNWDKVLEIDPGNRTAQLERQKALDLLERLRRMGAKVDC